MRKRRSVGCREGGEPNSGQDGIRQRHNCPRSRFKQALGVLIITVVVVAPTIFSKSGEGEGEEPAPEPPDDNEAADKLIDYSVDMMTKDDILSTTAATEDWKVKLREVRRTRREARIRQANVRCGQSLRVNYEPLSRIFVGMGDGHCRC